MDNQEKSWYDKYYRWALILPAVLIVFSIIYMTNFYNQHGDFIRKDVSLSGGATITVFDSKADASKMTDHLKGDFSDIKYRIISDFRTGQQKGISFETSAESEKIINALEKELGYELNNDNSSVEFSGASLSKGFYIQLISAILASFLLMSWVVFIVFDDSWKTRAIATALTFFGIAILLSSVGWLKAISAILIFTAGIVAIWKSSGYERWYLGIGALALIGLLYLAPYKIFLALTGLALMGIYIYNSIPSFAVIFCAFADILMTLTAVNIMGMSLSGAGIIAFLLLIGYSVDTDILLTSRLLKNRDGSINKRIYDSFKTGMTMTLTAIASIGVAFLFVYSFSETLKQIFGIILIGLGFDIINTWVTNTSLLKWFMEAKHKI